MMLMMHIMTVLLITIVVIEIKAFDECGEPSFHTDLIVGGKQIQPKEWPWIVALFYQNLTNLQFRCGATLVSRNIVVTAAHCILYYDMVLPPELIFLFMGRQRIYEWMEMPQTQTRNAAEIMIHPSIKTFGLKGADFAIIRLNKPVKSSDWVMPICLLPPTVNQGETYDKRGTVVGWGADESGFGTEEPFLTTMPLVSPESCLASNRKFRRIVGNFTLCGGERDGTGPCNGDSGSGMYILKTFPDQEERWVLRGVVSRSLRNNITGCDLSQYTVFTDVAKIAPWMRNYISNTETCKRKQEKKIRDLNMINIGERYYSYHNKWYNWSEAQTFCRAHGLELASLETEEEYDRVQSYHDQLTRGQLRWSDVWLSGNDEDRNGIWTWSGTGKNITYLFGYDEVFSSISEYNCLIMRLKRIRGHGWGRIECSHHRSFLCEMEEVCKFDHVRTVPELNMTKLGNKTYFIDLESELSWPEAEKFCMSYGLELISIITKEENDLLMEHVGKLKDSSSDLPSVWLSGFDEYGQGSWSWKASPYSFDFKYWASGKPEKEKSKKCLSFVLQRNREDHGWNNIECSRKQGFVCEFVV